MATMFLETHRSTREDILRMRIDTAPVMEMTATIAFEASTQFLSLNVLTSKPWSDKLTKQLRKAITGNPR